MGLPTLYTYAHSAPVLSSLVYLAGSCWQVAHDPSGAGGHHLVSRSLRPSCSATFSLSSSRRISFATVGMFSAVTNLGAGGLQDVSLSDTANGVLYATFALTGLISGGINNGSYTPINSLNILLIFWFILVLGPRLTLFFVSPVIHRKQQST